MDTIRKHLDEAKKRFDSSSLRFDIGLSIQKPSTDTLAVNLENEPFRDGDGRLVFRPGGHGALLANLQDLNGDIVFIKNIDNVVPDSLKAETYKYKKALGGLLLEVQERIFHFLGQLGKNRVSDKLLKEAFEFAS
ncbi:MAG: DUF4301 family protein, partial [Proteobacteria bacterium]|nr:DUF4301 family protein [Pseudomonadota bacterium]